MNRIEYHDKLTIEQYLLLVLLCHDIERVGKLLVDDIVGERFEATVEVRHGKLRVGAIRGRDEAETLHSNLLVRAPDLLTVCFTF